MRPRAEQRIRRHRLHKMWLSIFAGIVRVVSALSGLAGWFHDKGQRNIGEINTVARDQNIAIQIMRTALNAPRISSKAELDQKLNDGEL